MSVEGCGRWWHTATAAALVAAILPTAAPAQVFEVAASGELRQVDPGDPAAGSAAADPAAWPDDGSDDPAPDLPAEAVTQIVAPAVPAALRAPLEAAAGDAQVSPALLAALVRQESGWKANAVSAKGATGLAQLMPATARTLGVDPRDPAANLLGGAQYLRGLLDRFDGDLERALAAYNAGPARVIRAAGVPPIPETKTYVAAIIGKLGRAVAIPQGSLP